MTMGKVVLIIHNVRSGYNVGSLLRTAEGIGCEAVYISGYSPYPKTVDDERLPHVSSKAASMISKTALGAEEYINWHYEKDVFILLKRLRTDGFMIIALEQHAQAVDLGAFKPRKDIALLVGSEIGGIDKKILSEADKILQIPMKGKKESFNVAVAAAIALYQLKH